MWKIIKILFVILTPTILNAQRCNVCNETLRQGVVNVFQRETGHSFDESVNTLYSQDFEFWEKYESYANKSQAFDAAYSVYSASFKGTSNSETRKENYNRQKSSYQYSRSTTQNDYEKISQTLIDKTPFNSFNQCIRDYCGNGLNSSYSTTGDDIIVTVRWNLNNGDPNQVSTLQTVSLGNVKPIDFNFSEKQTTIKPLNSITGAFRRIDPKKDAIIKLNFSNLDVVEILEKGSQSSSILPIGTIISSNLEYAQFCTLNDIEISTTDYSKPSWVPADGRLVTNSKFSKVSPSVPDLRGVFLRGRNQFFSSGEPSMIESHRDNGTRSSDGFQIQAVQTHDHAIVDPGHQHDLMIHTEGTGQSEITLTYGWNNGNFGVRPDKIIRKAYTNIKKTENWTGEETRPNNISVFYYIKIN